MANFLVREFPSKSWNVAFVYRVLQKLWVYTNFAGEK